MSISGGGLYHPGEPNQDGPRNIELSRYLDLVGDGSGSKNHNADNSAGTGTPDIAFIQPGAGVIYQLHRMIVSVGDTTGFTAQEYGNLGSALGVGIEVRIQDGSGTIAELTDNIPVTTNAGWGELCYDVDVKSWGAGNELLVARWTFANSGTVVRLDGDNSERLEVTLDDDFTGLLTHRFLVQGFQEDNAT